MTVLGIVVLPVLVPFDEIAFCPDLQRVQPGTHVPPYLALAFIHSQNLAGLDAVGQQVP